MTGPQRGRECKSITHLSSTCKLGGHLIASHVFHCTCRTLYTWPNPPEPIFSQLKNSQESNSFSSPIFPGEFSNTSIFLFLVEQCVFVKQVFKKISSVVPFTSLSTVSLSLSLSLSLPHLVYCELFLVFFPLQSVSERFLSGPAH